MKTHSAKELKYTAQVLGSDSVTVLVAKVAVGVEFLSGRRLEHAQLISAETSHMVVLRELDAKAVTDSSYFNIGGVMYEVDYLPPSISTRPGNWQEVYCHVVRGGQ